MAQVFRACPHGIGSDSRDYLWLPEGPPDCFVCRIDAHLWEVRLNARTGVTTWGCSHAVAAIHALLRGDVLLCGDFSGRQAISQC